MKQLLLLFVFVLIGCSAPQEQTTSTFKVGLRSIAAENVTAQFPGGLVLYGVSGDKSFSRVMTAETQDEIIPNGKWNFFVLGWEGGVVTGAPMTGKVYCGSSLSVDLTGDPVEINIAVTNGNCANAPFNAYDSGAEFKFPSMALESCNKLSGISAYGDTCQYSTSVPGYVNTKGSALSFLLAARNYDKYKNQIIPVDGPRLDAGCLEVESVAGTAGISTPDIMGEINVPVGGPLKPWRFTLRAFYGTDNCVPGYGGKTLHFPAEPLNADIKHLKSGNSVTIYARTTVEEVCASGHTYGYTNFSASKFKGGTGEPGAPYVICRASDLNEINHVHKDENFIMGASVDLNPLTAVIGDGKAPPCASGGENFIPLGGYDSSDADHCADYDAAFGAAPAGTAFSGVFDGNKKVIEGLRLEKQDSSAIGFIRRLTASGKLLNARFKNIEIAGDQHVGIVGLADPGTYIDTLVAENVRVEGGNNYIGSVVGWSDADIQNIYVSKSQVISRGGSHIGGIAGRFASGTPKRLSFSGFIDAMDGQGGTNYGGIVGSSAIAIQEVASSGALATTGTQVGGIVGSTGGNITEFHSSMAVKSYSAANPASVGGIAGGGLITIQNGYFNGEVSCPGCGGGFGEIHGGQATDGGGIITLSYSALDTLIASIGNTNDGGLIGNNLLSSNGGNVFWAASAAGRYPKLAFELPGQCDDGVSTTSFANQKAAGRGSLSNPIIICAHTAFKNFLSANSSGEHYALAESFAVGTLKSSSARNLNAKLDGRGNVLSNFLLEVDSDQNTGLFSDIVAGGEVKNLNLFNIGVSGTTTHTSYLGLLAGANSGNIENVNVSGWIENPYIAQNLGVLAGANYGTIAKSRADGKISGQKNIGGLTALNTGSIILSSARVEIAATSNGTEMLGGLVGDNQSGGQISQSSAHGDIWLMGYSTTGKVGLFAGMNSGQIDNSYVDDSELRVGGVPADTGAGNPVGGFVGEHAAGSINKSYTLGKVITGVGYASVGGFAGSGAVDTTNLYFYPPVVQQYIAPGGETYACGSFSLSVTTNDDLTAYSYTDSDYIVINHGDDVLKNNGPATITDNLDGTWTGNFPVERCFGSAIDNMAVYAPVATNNTAGNQVGDYLDFRDYTLFTDPTVNWNIAEFLDAGGGYRQDDLISYHLNRLTGKPIDDPDYVEPIWEIDDRGAPRLLGLKD